MMPHRRHDLHRGSSHEGPRESADHFDVRYLRLQKSFDSRSDFYSFTWHVESIIEAF